MKKKIIAFAIAAALIVTMLPVAALAEGTSVIQPGYPETVTMAQGETVDVEITFTTVLTEDEYVVAVNPKDTVYDAKFEFNGSRNGGTLKITAGYECGAGCVNLNVYKNAENVGSAIINVNVTPIGIESIDPDPTTLTVGETLNATVRFSDALNSDYSCDVTVGTEGIVSHDKATAQLSEERDCLHFDLYGIKEGEGSVTVRISDKFGNTVMEDKLDIEVVSALIPVQSVSCTTSHNPVYGQTLAEFKAAGNPPALTVNPTNAAVVFNTADSVFYKCDSNNQCTVMADTDVFTKGYTYKVINKLIAADGYCFKQGEFNTVTLDGKTYAATVADDEKSVTFEHPFTVESSGSGSTPKTGDETNVAVLAGIIAMAAAAVIVSMVLVRRRAGR